MPTDLTEGACLALAGATSKATLDDLCSSRGIRWVNKGISWISLRVNVLKSSARTLLADTTSMLRLGLFHSNQQTYADVIHDLPTPRKASMTRRFPSPCKKSAISY